MQVELCINLFAYSENQFEEFVKQRSNWMDFFIVVISLVNVILASIGTYVGVSCACCVTCLDACSCSPRGARER
jgi:hypothetical protein